MVRLEAGYRAVLLTRVEYKEGKVDAKGWTWHVTYQTEEIGLGKSREEAISLIEKRKADEPETYYGSKVAPSIRLCYYA